jgi:hypothetical protein
MLKIEFFSILLARVPLYQVSFSDTCVRIMTTTAVISVVIIVTGSHLSPYRGVSGEALDPVRIYFWCYRPKMSLDSQVASSGRYHNTTSAMSWMAVAQ